MNICTNFLRTCANLPPVAPDEVSVSDVSSASEAADAAVLPTDGASCSAAVDDVVDAMIQHALGGTKRTTDGAAPKGKTRLWLGMRRKSREKERCNRGDGGCKPCEQELCNRTPPAEGTPS